MDESNKYWTYVIESESNKRLYVGCTKDYQERLTRHNCGNVKSTKKDAPYSLIYVNGHDTLSGARKQEKYLKSFKNPKYLRAYILRAVSSVGRALRL